MFDQRYLSVETAVLKVSFGTVINMWYIENMLLVKVAKLRISATDNTVFELIVAVVEFKRVASIGNQVLINTEFVGVGCQCPAHFLNSL